MLDKGRFVMVVYQALGFDPTGYDKSLTSNSVSIVKSSTPSMDADGSLTQQAMVLIQYILRIRIASSYLLSEGRYRL